MQSTNQEGALPYMTRVTIHGLNARSELNGLGGVVLGPPVDGRIPVKLDNNVAIKCKPDNVEHDGNAAFGAFLSRPAPVDSSLSALTNGDEQAGVRWHAEGERLGAVWRDLSYTERR